ncbi:unnamed protein product [Polarella glacialis]|uniref:Uncharacterized protein n=1 Tax=Polarella glacialis TaxID=89957 RepID=A0A813IU60_POLGL|nr:unnamed protein product [Polarella glacialis]
MPLQVLTDEEKSAALASASSDIRFHFDELQVHQDVQVAIYHGGFTSLRLFTALDESAPKVRECLKLDFGMDPTTDLPMRRQVALRKAELANLLFKRSVKACHAAHLAGARFLKEHPEDLGRVASGEPASTWQLPCTRQLAEDSDADTVALHQCRWPKVEVRKPTRLMGTVSNLRSMGHAGWPSFNKQGFYLGPLPQHCGHNHNALIGRNLAGNFHTAATAAYPPPMCSALADLFMQDFLLNTVVVRSDVTLTPTGGEHVQESVGKRQVTLKSAEEAESDLDEDGFTKPRFGSGLWGQGPPLSYVESGKLKHFSDGCGLCSPGRWEPERRQVVGSTLAGEVRAGLLKVLHDKLNVKKVLYQLACNQFTASPFEEALLLEGIATLVSLLEKHGAAGASAEVPPGQPVRLPALENFLQLCGDPDFRVFHSSSRSFSKGVTLGILGKLPRVPAVFDKKERWRKYPEEGGEPGDGDNYVSARDNLDSSKEQFEEERALGAMREVLEVDARKEYGSNLLIAPIGAIEKADASFRVIHDGTHKVQVNPRIRARDQHKCPGTGELKTVMRSSMKACKSVFGLTGDVKRAHRLPRVWQAEWGLQACKLSGDTVWLNEVGTFGMGPAAYHWARESGGMGRACLYLMQNRWFYQLLYADDFNWISTGAFAVDDIVLAIFFLCILGVPMSWKKFHGGLQYEWVGYWSDLRHRRLGISEGRADWLVRWMSKALVAGSVCIEEFKSVLGRMGFAMRALETFRPFLGPLYAWSSAACAHFPPASGHDPAHPHLPQGQVEGRGLTKEHFRADAKAEGEDVRIGGWDCLDSDDVGTARWFSETITRANAPWVFEAGEPFRTIATLELLATLCCLVAFPRDSSIARPEEPRALLTLGGSTDNLGNKFVADQLTNGDFRGFDPANRVRVDISKHRWVVLNSMLQQGRALYSVIREGRIESSKRKLDKFAGPAFRNQKSFRERDPWQCNRTSIADGNTWNHEHIATLGRPVPGAMWQVYGSGRCQLILMFLSFASIPLRRKFGFYQGGEPTPMMAESFLYKAVNHNLKKNVKLSSKLFKEVHSTRYGLMRIFQVMNVSEESKAWIANPENRKCDAPGSWYCVGQYPPPLHKLIAKRKNFAQLEDFNKHGQEKSAYTRMIEEKMKQEDSGNWDDKI